MFGFECGYNYADGIFPKGDVPDKKSEYRIESSQDGIKWRYEGGFIDGDASRFGMEMRPELAIKEAESFKAFWDSKNPGSKRFIRLIVDIL